MTVNLSRIVVLCLLLAALIVPAVAFEHQSASEQVISEPTLGGKVVITWEGKEIVNTNEKHVKLNFRTENGQTIIKVREGKDKITIIPIPSKK